MKEELRFAYLNADILCIVVTVLPDMMTIGVGLMFNGLIMFMSTTGVQSVARDTLGIAVMPR